MASPNCSVFNVQYAFTLGVECRILWNAKMVNCICCKLGVFHYGRGDIFYCYQNLLLFGEGFLLHSYFFHVHLDFLTI